MRLSVVVILAGLLASCVCVEDRRTKAFVDGVYTFGSLAATSVEFRDRNGRWPDGPRELKPLLTDPAIDVDRIDQILSFRTTPGGLALVNRRSNETAAVVANESTKHHLVLTGGGG